MNLGCFIVFLIFSCFFPFFLVQKRIFIFFIILIIPPPGSAHLNNLLDPASLVTTLLTQVTLVNLVHIAILFSAATLFDQKSVFSPLPPTRPHQQIILSALVQGGFAKMSRKWQKRPKMTKKGQNLAF